MREYTLILTLLMGAVATVVAGNEPTKTPTPNTKSEKTLSDVAGDIELDKKAAGGKDSIVISNENLSDLASKGRITEVTKQGPSQSKRGLADVQGTGAQIEGEAPGYGEILEKKQYWQAIYSRQLELVEDIRKQVDILDYDIPGLWRDFYSWDDPAYRDGVIKPKLDKAMARRKKLEVDMHEADAKLKKIENDARKDGGEPGWFRGFKKAPAPKPTVGIMPP